MGRRRTQKRFPNRTQMTRAMKLSEQGSMSEDNFTSNDSATAEVSRKVSRREANNSAGESTRGNKRRTRGRSKQNCSGVRKAVSSYPISTANTNAPDDRKFRARVGRGGCKAKIIHTRPRGNECSASSVGKSVCETFPLNTETILLPVLALPYSVNASRGSFVDQGSENEQSEKHSASPASPASGPSANANDATAENKPMTSNIEAQLCAIVKPASQPASCHRQYKIESCMKKHVIPEEGIGITREIVSNCPGNVQFPVSSQCDGVDTPDVAKEIPHESMAMMSSQGFPGQLNCRNGVKNVGAKSTKMAVGSRRDEDRVLPPDTASDKDSSTSVIDLSLDEEKEKQNNLPTNDQKISVSQVMKCSSKNFKSTYMPVSSELYIAKNREESFNTKRSENSEAVMPRTGMVSPAGADTFPVDSSNMYAERAPATSKMTVRQHTVHGNILPTANNCQMSFEKRRELRKKLGDVTEENLTGVGNSTGLLPVEHDNGEEGKKVDTCNEVKKVELVDLSTEEEQSILLIEGREADFSRLSNSTEPLPVKHETGNEGKKVELVDLTAEEKPSVLLVDRKKAKLIRVCNSTEPLPVEHDTRNEGKKVEPVDLSAEEKQSVSLIDGKEVDLTRIDNSTEPLQAEHETGNKSKKVEIVDLTAEEQPSVLLIELPSSDDEQNDSAAAPMRTDMISAKRKSLVLQHVEQKRVPDIDHDRKSMTGVSVDRIEERPAVIFVDSLPKFSREPMPSKEKIKKITPCSSIEMPLVNEPAPDAVVQAPIESHSHGEKPTSFLCNPTHDSEERSPSQLQSASLRGSAKGLTEESLQNLGPEWAGLRDTVHVSSLFATARAEINECLLPTFEELQFYTRLVSNRFKRFDNHVLRHAESVSSLASEKKKVLASWSLRSTPGFQRELRLRRRKLEFLLLKSYGVEEGNTQWNDDTAICDFPRYSSVLLKRNTDRYGGICSAEEEKITSTPERRSHHRETGVAIGVACQAPPSSVRQAKRAEIPTTASECPGGTDTGKIQERFHPCAGKLTVAEVKIKEEASDETVRDCCNTGSTLSPPPSSVGNVSRNLGKLPSCEYLRQVILEANSAVLPSSSSLEHFPKSTEHFTDEFAAKSKAVFRIHDAVSDSPTRTFLESVRISQFCPDSNACSVGGGSRVTLPVLKRNESFYTENLAGRPVAPDARKEGTATDGEQILRPSHYQSTRSQVSLGPGIDRERMVENITERDSTKCSHSTCLEYDGKSESRDVQSEVDKLEIASEFISSPHEAVNKTNECSAVQCLKASIQDLASTSNAPTVRDPISNYSGPGKRLAIGYTPSFEKRPGSHTRPKNVTGLEESNFSGGIINTSKSSQRPFLYGTGSSAVSEKRRCVQEACDISREATARSSFCEVNTKRPKRKIDINDYRQRRCRMNSPNIGTSATTQPAQFACNEPPGTHNAFDQTATLACTQMQVARDPTFSFGPGSVSYYSNPASIHYNRHVPTSGIANRVGYSSYAQEGQHPQLNLVHHSGQGTYLPWYQLSRAPVAPGLPPPPTNPLPPQNQYVIPLPPRSQPAITLPAQSQQPTSFSTPANTISAKFSQSRWSSRSCNAAPPTPPPPSLDGPFLNEKDLSRN